MLVYHYIMKSYLYYERESIQEDIFMLHITSLDEGLKVFKALGSDVRIEIVKLLLKNKEMSMNELASELSITNGALTNHIKKLLITLI